MAWIDNRGIVTRKTWNRLVDWLDASNTCLTSFTGGAQQVIGTRFAAYKVYGDGIWGCDKGHVAADYTFASRARDVLTVHAFDKFPGCTPALWQAGEIQNYLGCIPFNYERGEYWLWSDKHPYELGDVREPWQYPNAFDITQPQYCDLYAEIHKFVPHVYAQRRPETGGVVRFLHGVLINGVEHYPQIQIESMEYPPADPPFSCALEFLPHYIAPPPQVLRLPDGAKINVAKAKITATNPNYINSVWHFEKNGGSWQGVWDYGIVSQSFVVPVTLMFMGVLKRPFTREDTLINWKYYFTPLPFSWQISQTSQVIDVTNLMQWMLDNRGKTGYLGYALVATLTPGFTSQSNVQAALSSYCLNIGVGQVVPADPPWAYWLLNGWSEEITLSSLGVESIYLEYTLPKDFSKHVVEYRNVSPMELE